MTWEIKHGDWIDVLRTMPDESIQCCVTSPPYWGLRDYGVSGQLGLERTPEEYVGKVVAGFREVRRILRKDGTCWINLGDSYASDATGRNDTERETPGGKGGSFRGGKRSALDIDSGLKSKDLCGIPWMVAFALRSDGWYLRQDIIWAKGSCMPESVTDRCTKSHEYIFLLSRSSRYYFAAEAIAEPAVWGTETRHDRISPENKCQVSEKVNALRPKSHKGSEFNKGKTAEHQLGRSSAKPRTSVPRGGFNGKTNAMEGREAFRAIEETRNKRSVWNVNPQPFPEAHFATFPPKLIEPCILAGCPEDGTVLDPFSGAGTTGLVATRLHRNFIGIELNAEYITMARRRIEQDAPLFNTATAVSA